MEEEQQNAREGVARPNPPQREFSMPQTARRTTRPIHFPAQRRPRRQRYSIRVNEQPAQSDHEVGESSIESIYLTCDCIFNWQFILYQSSRSEESSFTGASSTSSSESEFSDSDWGGGPAATPKKTSNTTGERRRTARNASEIGRAHV